MMQWEIIRHTEHGAKVERFWRYQDALDELARLAGLPSSAWGPNYYAVDITPRKTVSRVIQVPDETYLVWHH